jgi:ABC-type uncharacterized transport system auxiliary subunit
MRVFILLLISFSLSACLTSGRRGNESVPQVYDLTLAHDQSRRSARPLATSIEVRAPLWLDTMAIDYRLRYAEPARLREYSRARWVGPPSQLIQQRLGQELGLLAPGQAGARCLLRLELGEFAQWFDTPERSRSVLSGRVQLLDKSRALLATKDVHIELPADSPDSAGAVRALALAVDRLAADLQDWVKSRSQEEKIAVCGF